MIRKTGAYLVGWAPVETQKGDPFEVVEDMKAEREARLKQEVQVKEQTAQRT